MSSLINKLKSLFVTEEKSAKDEADKSSQVSSEIDISSAGDDVNPEVKQEYLNILFKAIEENDIEGFDYLEFKESLKSLEGVEMDESMRFKSALAMANSMQADKQKLIDSAATYLKVLENEEEKFNAVLKNQVSSKISGNQRSIEELELLISGRQEEIKKLNSEIRKLEQRMDLKREQLEVASVKLKSVQLNFRASYEYLVNEIKRDIDYLKKN